MRKYANRLTVILATLIMVLAFTIGVNAESYGDLASDYSGKTIVLSTNDVHGALDQYKYLAGLKSELEKRGAEVILVDCGDFSQGTTYVSESKGASAVEVMNLVGYTYSTLGNHEFDFGAEAIESNLKKAKFTVLSTNFINKKSGNLVYDATATYASKDSDLVIGFLGIATPETLTKALPTNFTTNTINIENNFAVSQSYVDDLKDKQKADVVIALTHLGVDAESEPFRSYDLYNANKNGSHKKIDMILDGHSHTVMTEGENKEPIMSTGTKLKNIGVVVLDEATEKIESNFLVTVDETIPADAEVAAKADSIIAEVDAAYGAKIGESKVDLNGGKTANGDFANGNRDGETNMGDLITDAMKWHVTKSGTDLGVPAENVVVITNGGGIRAPIGKGDISKQAVLTVLPFGNTIAAVTVTGAELLEALEASTQELPIGGFPQVEGITFNLETAVAYDIKDEKYPDSTYCGPKSIQRVWIEDVNGKRFDPDAKYVVLTNNFCAEGGDTYYVFKNASNQFDTGITLDAAVSDFIVDQLGGVVDSSYAEPQGRITTKTLEEAKAEANADLDAISTEGYSGKEKEKVEKAIADAKAAVEEAKTVREAKSSVLDAKDKIDKAIKDKETFKSGGNSYKMVSVSKKTVAFTKAKNAKNITVPATVKYKGRTFNVVQINANAFKAKKIRTVTVGKNVNKIAANAFKGSKATKMILKTKKLKKAKVKNSLKSSKIKTIQVKVGKKKDNKNYVKKYKKIFTKKNAGKSVKFK